ncbi:AraC family transcriptional regulator [Ilyomonas limi]|uniref:AraC family transcriptional regulator n=1 Tax=Ilyomonas limi TaxID=2575867 RepID=A0A4U3L2K8_9BACT|nr:helix-turn-helix domain-containing protein [Ilyomonas limi]TKK67757.1 AraC family transcriptional regulator [Ilyomonas limi]
MKILQTEITPAHNSYISVIERNEPFFKSPFHYHPEVELVYIKESYGKRVIGDKIEPFYAGDLVLVGSNLPHVWLSDENFHQGLESTRAKSVVTYFNKDIFGDGFYNLREVEKINVLFRNAQRGLKIEGATRIKIIDIIERLVYKTGFDRVLGLLEILHILSTSEDIQFINSETYSGVVYNKDTDRLAEVFKYIKTSFGTDITLNDVAKKANLTPQSFCRLFKKRMNKHFMEYLNEVRISHACRYLMDTDCSISEIAYMSGFKTVSNFNKVFKENTGYCPTSYRLKAS